MSDNTTPNDMNNIPPQANAVSLYGQADAMDDFPVLKAFQQYVDAEQAKAHKRLMTVCVFFTVVMTIVIAVFMFIILASITNSEKGRIPITFILICILYLGNEFMNAFRNDNISQLAHIVGGACGGFFGLFIAHTGGVKAEEKNFGTPPEY